MDRDRETKGDALTAAAAVSRAGNVSAVIGPQWSELANAWQADNVSRQAFISCTTMRAAVFRLEHKSSEIESTQTINSHLIGLRRK